MTRVRHFDPSSIPPLFINLFIASVLGELLSPLHAICASAVAESQCEAVHAVVAIAALRSTRARVSSVQEVRGGVVF